MNLSDDLISQFVKVTKDSDRTKKETTVYGTVRHYQDRLYVQIDGSELLTPVSTTVDTAENERVIVRLKDHTATITGNISSPSARSGDLVLNNADISNIKSDNILIKQQLIAAQADIEKLRADFVEIGDLVVDNVDAATVNALIANVNELQANKLNVETASATYATIENMNGIYATIDNIEATMLNVDVADARYASIDSLTSINASITDLQASKLNATTASLTYANIDFSNINMLSVEKLFSKSGIIKDLVVNDTNITGELVGVTIKGDLIEGNTIIANKLVIQGSDGLYYKLNTDGMKTEASQTDYNSLNGSVITTKSITANKIAVEDLVAFGATIGGFKITNSSIYSGSKSSSSNTTRGIFLGNDGQISIGDSSNYLKYYKDQNGYYKLEISADNMILSSTNKNIEEFINEVVDDLANYTSTTNAELENLQNQIDRIYNTYNFS